MEYWRGYMGWPLNSTWKCETCGENVGLEWGLIHAQCRCNRCHTQYRMRDTEGNVVDTPICQLKEEYKKAAQAAVTKYNVTIDEITDEQWEMEYFRENLCQGKQYDSCQPCIYAGGHSRTHGGFECRHPQHPDNIKRKLDTGRLN